jgi:hypothetical protein
MSVTNPVIPAGKGLVTNVLEVTPPYAVPALLVAYALK